MRMRVIQPTFWTSDDVAAMDWYTRLIFIGLWSYVEDNGVGKDNPSLIRGTLFALDEDQDEVLRRISTALDALEEGGQILRYQNHDGKPLLYCPTWDKNQHPKNPTKPKYPRPSSDNANTGQPAHLATTTAPDGVRTSSGEPAEKDRTESQTVMISDDQLDTSDRPTKKGRPRRPATPLPEGWEPTDDHHELARNRGVNLADEAEMFRAHATATDRRMRDWNAAFRQWLIKAHTPNNVHRLPAQPATPSPKPREKWHSQPTADAAFQVPEPQPGMQGRWA